MVRYADAPTVEVAMDVSAPVAAVWDYIVDIDLPARFSNEFQGAEWIPPADAPSLGARFRGRNRHPAVGEWQTECEVAWFEPERSFGWHVVFGAEPAASWRFDLEPLRSDTTRLKMWAQMGPGPSGLTPAIEAMPDEEERIVERRLSEWRENMQATVAGVKALAEAR